MRQFCMQQFRIFLLASITDYLYLYFEIFCSATLVCLYCTKFGHLMLRKIIKIVATRCHILRLKCTKFDLSLGSTPDPSGGAHSKITIAGFERFYF